MFNRTKSKSFQENSEYNQKQFDKQFFTIYDSKVGTYRAPILAINEHDVLRQIDTLFRDPDQKRNQLLLNAEDFSLFKIAEYSEKTGEIRPIEPIQHVANLHDIRSVVQRDNPMVVKDLPHPNLA